MIWRKKELQVLQRWGGSPDHKERRERAVHRGLHKENTSPNLLTGKMRGIDYHKFSQHWSSKTKVLEVHSMASVDLGIVVLLWRRRSEAQEQTV